MNHETKFKLAIGGGVILLVLFWSLMAWGFGHHRSECAQKYCPGLTIGPMKGDIITCYDNTTHEFVKEVYCGELT